MSVAPDVGGGFQSFAVAGITFDFARIVRWFSIPSLAMRAETAMSFGPLTSPRRPGAKDPVATPFKLDAVISALSRSAPLVCRMYAASGATLGKVS